MSNNVLSRRKMMEIENVVRAYVASDFAMMTNARYRGVNFTWDSFIKRCERNADLWMFISAVKGNKKLVTEYAKKFARQNAEHLVQLATEDFIKDEND